MKLKKLLCSTLISSVLLTGCASGLFQNYVSEENDSELNNLAANEYLKEVNPYNQRFLQVYVANVEDNTPLAIDPVNGLYIRVYTKILDTQKKKLFAKAYLYDIDGHFQFLYNVTPGALIGAGNIQFQQDYEDPNTLIIKCWRDKDLQSNTQKIKINGVTEIEYIDCIFKIDPNWNGQMRIFLSAPRPEKLMYSTKGYYPNLRELTGEPTRLTPKYNRFGLIDDPRIIKKGDFDENYIFGQE